MKEKKINKNVIKRVARVLAMLLVVIVILVIAQNIEKEKANDKISLIINNRNVTERLKHDIKIEDDIIYVSIDDVENPVI